MVAFVIAIAAAFAFNVPQEEASQTYWFDYNGSTIGDYIGTSESSVCPEFSGTHCALAFPEDDVIINGSDVQLKPGVDEMDAIDDAFRL